MMTGGGSSGSGMRGTGGGMGNDDSWRPRNGGGSAGGGMTDGGSTSDGGLTEGGLTGASRTGSGKTVR